MTRKIPIVGIGPDGLAGLTTRSREWLESAQVVFGSDNTLRLIPDLKAEQVPIGSDLPAIVDRIKSSLETVPMAVVATGDPLFYGTARYLCDKIGGDHFEVVPHVSSMQLAFARVKETWEEAYLTDLSARRLEDVIDKVRIAETVGLFTSDTYTPNRVARELLARGIDYFRCYVCENLGGRDERITSGELNEVQDMRFDPLNVMILRRKPDRPDRQRVGAKLRRFGNADDLFAQSRPKTGLITQAEVRAIALAQLDLRPGDVAWDVGAGSGSVAIEMAQLVSPGTVYAIEEDSADYHLIVANADTFGVSNVKAVYGTAPKVFVDLPKPDAVFVGGNGGEVVRLLEAAYEALRPGGRLVSNVGTLEMISATHQALKKLAGNVDVLLISLSRGVEQMESLRFDAISPSVILGVRKPD